jgi:hypothetical protein
MHGFFRADSAISVQLGIFPSRQSYFHAGRDISVQERIFRADRDISVKARIFLCR